MVRYFDTPTPHQFVGLPLVNIEKVCRDEFISKF